MSEKLYRVRAGVAWQEVERFLSAYLESVEVVEVLPHHVMRKVWGPAAIVKLEER